VNRALEAEVARMRALWHQRRQRESYETVRRERDEARAEARAAIRERDEMRRANVTPEDADRPLGQSVEYWQDRALDYATALDKARQRIRALEKEEAGKNA
jgi:hypothetical protein